MLARLIYHRYIGKRLWIISTRINAALARRALYARYGENPERLKAQFGVRLRIGAIVIPKIM